MTLGKEQILKALKSNTWKAYKNNILIDADSLTIGPNSIDVTLHPSLLASALPSGYTCIDPHNPNSIAWFSKNVDSLGAFSPGEFLLGATNERVDCSAPLIIDGKTLHFAPMYDGRSTLGRLGIGSHVTAGFGDYGFAGAFTLELFNVNQFPVKLHSNMRIGQVFFVQVLEPGLYTGAYSKSNHYNGPVPPELGPKRFA
jgi:dCTP deaminase